MISLPGIEQIVFGGGITCVECDHYFKIWYESELPKEMLKVFREAAKQSPGDLVLLKDEGLPVVNCPSCGHIFEVPATAAEFRETFEKSHPER